jgi:glutamate-1-semialdehyde 2,1-aminomutase
VNAFHIKHGHLTHSRLSYVTTYSQQSPADIFQVTKRFSPSGVELVRFTNSGTESNTMALAAAVAFTGRKKILVFKNGYHGGTLSFPSTLKDVNVNLPHDFILAPYNDIEGTKRVISALPVQSLAAIIVECIQGSGGCIVGSIEFLQFLDTTAKKMGALFIVDEVMTSRLSYHGYSSFLGLKPDIVTLGKWIGGGMSFGAFGGRRDGGVMGLFDPRSGILAHSGTFNNNIITMAAGCAGIEIYNEVQVNRLNALGEELKSRINGIFTKYKINTSAHDSSKENELESPFTGLSLTGVSLKELSLFENQQTPSSNSMWISGKGSMLNIHFAGDSEKSLRAIFWHHMLDNGIYIAQRGFLALNIKLNDNHISKFADATEDFVMKYSQALQH